MPLSQGGCFVIKLHGDYRDPRILNTEEELGRYDPRMRRLLDRVLDEFGLLVVVGRRHGILRCATESSLSRLDDLRVGVTYSSAG
jgi:hypothetical protein